MARLPPIRAGPESVPVIRVVLAEDDVLLREGVSRLIEAQTDLDLVGMAGDLPGLLAAAVQGAVIDL